MKLLLLLLALLQFFTQYNTKITTLCKYLSQGLRTIDYQDNSSNMFSTPKRTKQATSTCPPPPARTRTTGARSSSPSSSLASSFTSTTSLGSIFSKVDLSENSSIFDLNGLSFTPPRLPAYPCLSDDDDVHRHVPAKLKPRPSRQEHY